MDGPLDRPGPRAGRQGAGREAQGSAGEASGEAAAGDRDVHDRRDAAEGRGRGAELQRRGGEVARVPGTQEVEGVVEGSSVMDREQLEFRITQYLDGDLPAAEVAALEQVLAVDADARKVLGQHRALDAALKRELPVPQMKWDR